MRDQRHYEPRSPEDLTAEFPSWEVWRGVNQLWYARLLKSSPPVVVRGEDLTDLRDQVIAWIWRQA